MKVAQFFPHILRTFVYFYFYIIKRRGLIDNDFSLIDVIVLEERNITKLFVSFD